MESWQLDADQANDQPAAQRLMTLGRHNKSGGISVTFKMGTSGRAQIGDSRFVLGPAFLWGTNSGAVVDGYHFTKYVQASPPVFRLGTLSSRVTLKEPSSVSRYFWITR